MGRFIKAMEHWLGGGPGGTKRIQTYRWLLLIGIIGVSLMLMNSFFSFKEIDSIGTGRASPKSENTKEVFIGSNNKEKMTFSEYEHEYESQLRDILQKIVGVGTVEVMVTMESTEEINVEKNVKDTQHVTTENDKNGTTRHITDVTRSGEVVIYQVSGSQNPLVLKYIKPKIRGVVVVANGAENMTVKKLISEAVERGLAVPPNRISVLPRKQ